MGTEDKTPLFLPFYCMKFPLFLINCFHQLVDSAAPVRIGEPIAAYPGSHSPQPLFHGNRASEKVPFASYQSPKSQSPKSQSLKISSSLPRSTSTLKRWFDPASLQFRLTLGVTAVSILGVGGVSGWTSWKMQEILIRTHTNNIKYLGERFPLDVQLYQETLPVETSLQRTIDKAPAEVWMWVEDQNGAVVAESQQMRSMEPRFREQLSLAEMPSSPEVHQFQQRYFVLCSTDLVIQGRFLGQLRIVQDITADRLKFSQSLQGLHLVTLFSVGMLAFWIAWYVQRSLRPLREMSQAASTVSARDLSQTRLTLKQAPTEVKELAEKLNEMLSRLGLSWEQQRQLISDISHELRTPLSVTYGSLQCLQRRSTAMTDTQNELLDTAISETDRTIQLLQSLLELARAEQGCICLRSERLLLNELVADIIKLIGRDRQHLIHINTSDEIWLTADRDCLMQILTHLLENAIQYSAAEEPIILTLSQSSHYITIEVRDFGCGISPEQQDRVFDRFYRVDTARSRATGGAGLGLSITKILIEAMNGKISVWAHPDEGTLFTVVLPSELNYE
jgi:signal transduction histidine kinase